MRVRYYGWVAARDPMFPRQIIKIIDEVFDTLQAMIDWWNAFKSEASGLWNGQAVEVTDAGVTIHAEQIIGTPRERGGYDSIWTPPTVAASIHAALVEARTAAIEEAAREGAADPERELWGKVVDVGQRYAREAAQALLSPHVCVPVTPENVREPIARISLHSRSPVVMLADAVPPNVSDRLMMGFPRVDDGPAGKGVVLAVLDTGCNTSHPCFRGATVMPVIDCTGHGPVPDSNGHGTFVCGQIVSQVPAGAPAGTAPRASIVPIRVLHPRDGWGTDSQIARGVRAAMEVGADLISMSLGGPDPMPATADALAVARSKGIVILVAAGNDGAGPGDVSFPGRYSTVLCVGSIDASGRLSTFSNRGTSLDLCASGEQQIGPTGDNTFGRWSGTSMATPHVAAASARWIAAWRALSDAEHPAGLLEQCILDECKNQNRDWSRGGKEVGILQADASIMAIQVPAPVPPVDPPAQTPAGHVVLEVSEQVYQWLQLTGERFDAGPKLTIKKGPKWDGK